jgi:hypothetical protein
MPQKIKIVVGSISVSAELADTECAKAISGKLPIETVPNEWGDEFYFAIPAKLPLDATATRKVRIGDIGYWPPGTALAIFFGRTPMSTGPDPVPASEVNLVGRIVGDALSLKKAKGAARIRIEKE